MISHGFDQFCSKGFLDLNLTEFRKGGANITGFQLMNYTDPMVSRTIDDWLDFDSKDLKSPKRRLKVKNNIISEERICSKHLQILIRNIQSWVCKHNVCVTSLIFIIEVPVSNSAWRGGGINQC